MSDVLEHARLERLEEWRVHAEERLGNLAGVLGQAVGVLERVQQDTHRIAEGLASVTAQLQSAAGLSRMVQLEATAHAQETATRRRRRVWEAAKWAAGAIIGAAAVLVSWWAR